MSIQRKYRPEPFGQAQSVPGPGPNPGNPRSSAEMIISSLKDGIIFLDNKGLVSRVNSVMEELLGISEPDAVGRSMKDVTGEPEICLLITTKTGKTSDTFRHKGREFEVEGLEVYDESGERAGTVTLFHDVTEVRKLERQRTEIMSMITHDLKAPLTAVTGHADLILEGSLGEVNPDVRESVEAMARGGEKVLSIIDDYLTISKLEAGQIKPSLETVKLGDIVGEVVSAVVPEAGRKGRRIDLEVELGLPEAQCDPAQIERVITNLLNNAVKFTHKKGRITVGVKTADAARVKELAGDEPEPGMEYAELFVEDDGIGIPESELPYLFDRYWRGGGAGKVKGTGLGLAIVKSIVEAHHGMAGVASREGKGSRFHVLLPLRQPAHE